MFQEKVQLALVMEEECVDFEAHEEITSQICGVETVLFLGVDSKCFIPKFTTDTKDNWIRSSRAKLPSTFVVDISHQKLYCPRSRHHIFEDSKMDLYR